MDQGLNQKIDAYIAENKEQLLQDIAALVAIDSVEGTPEEGAPFGKGPRAALDKTLELAAGMGLATRNCENYMGYAELAGADPEKYLATICHVDVVPVGNGWTADPFKMRIQDGWLLGRGVSDDKGPMVVTLYALKFLKEQGYELRYPIRALIGDNEETHMQDVEYYLKNYPAPVFCFTPDAEFPVCNGEKGHFGAKIVSPVCNGVICDFEGGVANNAVPDRASALLHTDITKLKNAPNITLEPAGEGCVRVRGWGKAGHAAMPEGTVNAIGLVVNYLLDNGLCNDAERAYLEALRKLHASTAGTGLGIDCADGPFGPLTIIGGRIYMEEGRLVQTIDSRFPTCTDGDKLAAQVTAALGSGAQLQDVDAAEPFYIEADSPAIQACINTYNEVTGEDAKPFTMGGGTYARHFPSINWLTSYSEYADDLRLWYDEHVGPEFVTCRHQMAHLLQKESELMEIVKLIGADILPEDQKLIIETAKLFRVGFLQQNAYHPIDTYVPLDKQLRMMELMLKLYHGAKDIVSRAIPLSQLKETGIFESLAKMKYEVPNDGQEKFAEYDAAIEDALRQVNEANR